MLSADNTGQIAIRSTGRYPIRPGDGDGRRLFDGTTTKSDWIGWWSPDEYPQAKNPAQGFLVSANQEPQAPEDQPRYLGAAFAPPWRAMRINEHLRADSAMTADKMRRLQTDPGSARADFFLPRLLAAADRGRASGAAGAALDSALAVLGAWSRAYRPEDEAAVLFEAAMSELSRRTWDEMRGDTTGVAQWLEVPSNTVLARLMEDGASRWWDDASTPEVETRDAIVAVSLAAAWDTTVARHGARADGRWRWGTAAPMRIPHLLRLDAFASEPLAVRSGPHTIAPRNGASNGASWRMVAELGDTVRVLGTYPGGQSGNPFSSRYLDRTAKWVAGELDTLWMPPSLDRMDPTRVRSSLTLRPLGGRP
jgi:penicillin amidase